MPQASAATASKLLLGNGVTIDDSGGQLTISGPTGTKILQLNSSGIITNSTGAILTPSIVKTVVQSAATNVAPTTLSFTPPSVAGTYRISAQLNATTATTLTFKNILGYTDSTAAARTDIPVWERQNSATMLVAPTANTADRFVQGPFLFSIDNSGTAITLGDNAGTYTTCVYDYTVVLERLI